MNKQDWKDLGAIVFFFLFLGLLIAWVVFYLTGPCSVLEHLALTDIPGRCLKT